MRLRGTDKKAGGLQTEYRKKDKVDQEGLCQGGEVRGPVERRQDEFGGTDWAYNQLAQINRLGCDSIVN